MTDTEYIRRQREALGRLRAIGEHRHAQEWIARHRDEIPAGWTGTPLEWAELEMPCGVLGAVLRWLGLD